MSHPQTRSGVCPICRAAVEITCHVTAHTGHSVDNVVLDRARCPNEGDDGHGPVAAVEWAQVWVDARPRARSFT
jgi:hypothetical protein